MSIKIEKSAQKEAKKKKIFKLMKITITLIILFLINLYIILAIIYKGENFTITLDSEYGRESGLVIYESLQDKRQHTYLKCKDIDFFSDISILWLPENIDNEGDGSHNGEHYIAYTFYAENQGQETINYWSKIEIDDVIKDVDDAIRVMVIKNGERTVYAKLNHKTNQPEEGTVPFYSEEKKLVMNEQTKDFKVGDIDKYTVVIWVEGDDPECLDNLIGGEIKMHMTLTEEHINNEETNE